MIKYFLENDKIKIRNLEKLQEYFSYIETHKLIKSEKYKTAKHHILPRSLFPEYINFTKNPWNKVILSHYHHYYAHYLLALAIESYEMDRAFIFMHSMELSKDWKQSDITLISESEFNLINQRSNIKQGIMTSTIQRLNNKKFNVYFDKDILVFEKMCRAEVEKYFRHLLSTSKEKPYYTVFEKHKWLNNFYIEKVETKDYISYSSEEVENKIKEVTKDFDYEEYENLEVNLINRKNFARKKHIENKKYNIITHNKIIPNVLHSDLYKTKLDALLNTSKNRPYWSTKKKYKYLNGIYVELLKETEHYEVYKNLYRLVVDSHKGFDNVKYEKSDYVKVRKYEVNLSTMIKQREKSNKYHIHCDRGTILFVLEKDILKLGRFLVKTSYDKPYKSNKYYTEWLNNIYVTKVKTNFYNEFEDLENIVFNLQSEIEILRYNIIKEDKIIKSNLIKKDLSKALLNSSKSYPLGHSNQAKSQIIRNNNGHLIGCYSEPVKVKLKDVGKYKYPLSK